MNRVLWQPSENALKNTNLSAFRRFLKERQTVELSDYPQLHQWSVREPEKFWLAVWDYCGVVADNRGDRVLIEPDKMPGAAFFPDAKLNYAENLLKRNDQKQAIVFWGEDKVKREVSWSDLQIQVARVQQKLKAAGVGVGDCVAGFMPNMPETVVAMLATAGLGAVWTSCSPDFGVQGVLDRFGQVAPKVLFACNGYYYNGKAHDSQAKLNEFVPQISSLNTVILVEYTPCVAADVQINGVSTQWYDDVMSASSETRPHFESLPFSHPLYVMYSSGTTGKPKCIVHSAGGVLLKHLVEHQFHTDLKPQDKLFYFTTCGWMMWNWLVSGLASEATLMLYDGSPFYPSGEILFDFAEAENCTVFGTSAKYIDALNKADIKPIHSHQLHSIRAILSTGSPLVPESFDYVYRDLKKDVQLSSVSGGTDILGCFVLGCPELPVVRGELQCLALGLDVQVFSDDGQPLSGEKGELVCVNPFPSMPIGFWGDVDGSRYHDAYFNRYPNVWCHGDYVEITDTGGVVIYGRSDTTLNPGGVRIGTAEIYRQVEQLDSVLESLVIGQNWQGDVRVILFVRLREGVQLDEALVIGIKSQIRQHTTPRHVPAKVIAVTDIPRTKSGKIVELAVRDVVHGDPVKNKDALANPEALALFADLVELQA